MCVIGLTSIDEDNSDDGKYNTAQMGGLTLSALKKHNSTHRTHSLGGSSQRSETGLTHKTNQSVAESVISKAMSRKGKF